jgi:hypothetical protein
MDIPYREPGIGGYRFSHDKVIRAAFIIRYYCLVEPSMRFTKISVICDFLWRSHDNENSQIQFESLLPHSHESTTALQILNHCWPAILSVSLESVIMLMNKPSSYE